MTPYCNYRIVSDISLVDSLGTLLDTLSCSNVYVCYTDRYHLPSVLIANSFQFVMNWNDFALFAPVAAILTKLLVKDILKFSFSYIRNKYIKYKNIFVHTYFCTFLYIKIINILYCLLESEFIN